MSVEPPLALLAEITHRCPMRCVYCSNPLNLEPASRELDTTVWRRVLDEASGLGVLQVHFSGGEPLARQDIVELIGHASRQGLYANLITSGIQLDLALARRLAGAGLEHVQLSVQDTEADGVERIGGLKGALERKRRAAEAVRETGLALTLNAVVHRGNAGRVAEFVDLAVDMGARRLEVAHVQYYGWGLVNRAGLMPTRSQVGETTRAVEAARERYRGVLAIDYVVPDYYARLPKACMGGWGRRFLLVDPAGRVLPCHAATTVPGLDFATVTEQPLEEIWTGSPAFAAFRGTEWMAEPCRSCDRREVDWGGCRCQALALSGNAANTDPACHKSPHHAAMVALAEREAAAATPTTAAQFTYRGTERSGRRGGNEMPTAPIGQAEGTCSGS